MLLRSHLIATLLGVVAPKESLAHGHGLHHHHHHDHDHHDHRDGRPRNLRGPPGGVPPGLCKDGDSTFIVGGHTYMCEAEFNAVGGQCRTPDRTPEEKAAVAAAFRAWLERKGKGKGKPAVGKEGGPFERKLAGCDNCVDWDGGQVITVPVNFHIFHNGNDGKQFICKYTQGSGFTELDGGSCEYVKEQIRVLNRGFGGIKQDTQPTLYNDNTKFQFCLIGANDVEDTAEYDNAVAYGDSSDSYKSTFRSGGMETLNVWVNQAGGNLGYAYFPSYNVGNLDGIVLLGTSMPDGGTSNYQEGDTLPHEVSERHPALLSHPAPNIH